ncbi:glycosyltransferase [Conexibacter woesei]|uniref:glycosyltransferase n=1 Tax=Conexibacter woesei TaxID=191495 RepID=UPI00040B0D36|nr:glycosyltransferase [Conexibacter woesei]
MSASAEPVVVLAPGDAWTADGLQRLLAAAAAHPGAGLVHGDALLVDDEGRERGRRAGARATGPALIRRAWRGERAVAAGSFLVRRDVLDALGRSALDDPYNFILRAAAVAPVHHVEGEPVVRTSAAADARAGQDAAGQGAALLAALDGGDVTLRDLVPELDWPILHPDAARRRALELLAGVAAARTPALPRVASELQRRAAALPVAPAPRRDKGKLVMTAFGWNDSGGGTMLPRFAAKELVRRGWDVVVFHAAVAPDPSGVPYAIREWEEDGVRLVGVHNRAHGLLDLGAPERELDDPPITAAFADLLDRERPDVIHFHNLHNLGAALLDAAAARGIPSYFTTHNYWLACPRAYLLRGDQSLCGGPGDAGGDCAACVGSHDVGGHQARLAGIREAFSRAIGACLTVSHGVRRTLVDQGYPAAALDVVRQCVPAEDEAWERVGRDRVPGRLDDQVLHVGFFGSVYPHKGAQLLVAAAQAVAAEIRVHVHGEIPDRMAHELRRLDRRGLVELHGKFEPTELPDLLARVDAAALPSLWWDCAPLVAGECLAARVPLLSPRMGGLADAIEDGVDGLAFDGGDQAQLTVALERLAGEAGLLERLQSNIAAPRGFAAYVDELEAYYGGARPSRVHDEPPLAVSWVGEHDAPTSLARINRSVVAGLAGDPELTVRAAATDRPVASSPLPHAADVEVRHQWPPDLRPPASGHLALIQPWEFGAVPEAWVGPLNTVVDELWVPSEHVREMYVSSGVEADRVAVVPNGVDLDAFAPEGPAYDLGDRAPGTRFLFVGGAIGRKGIDVLLGAWQAAFTRADDVTLIVKDFGAEGVYRGGDRAELQRLAADPDGPRVVHLTETLSDAEVSALYRACDVLVHPYRGEGFAMPVLEAMACGRPVLLTGGGPTDEFCPPEAGWRIASQRALIPGRQISGMALAGDGWMLEPDAADLTRLLREVAETSAEERARRGVAGRAAAAQLGWDAVSARYAERLKALSERPARIARTPDVDLGLEDDDDRLRLLAVPAYRGTDRLADLLAAWAQAAPSGTPATLVLVADPGQDGDAAGVEGHIVAAAAAAGADLDACADIEVRFLHATPGRDAALAAATDAFVPLHGASEGHARRARAAGNAVVAPDAGAIAAFLATAPAVSATGR